MPSPVTFAGRTPAGVRAGATVRPSLGAVAALCMVSLAVMLRGIGGANFIETPLIIAGVVTVLLVFVAPPEWLMVGVILAASMNYSVLLDNRINVGPFPVSIGDLVVVAYGYYGLVHLWRGHPMRPSYALGVLVGIWFLYNSFVGIGVGLIQGNTAYGILQEYRVVLFAAIGYVATVVIFRRAQHLRSIIFGQIAAGIVVSVWQIAITFSGRGLDLADIVTLGGAGRVLRDVNLPLPFAGSALATLICVQAGAPSLLGRARFLTWMLVPLFVMASVLSQTRTVWIAIALSLGLSLLFRWLAIRPSQRLSRLVTLVLAAVAFVAMAFGLIRAVFPDSYQALSIVWESSLSLNDITFWTRLEQPMDLWRYFLADKFALWLGQGFGSISTGAIRYGPFTAIHNVYMWYMIFGGLPGLLLFLALWIAPLTIYVRLRTAATDPVERAFAAAAIVNWLVTSVVMLGSPALWTNSALFGLQLGVASCLAGRHPAAIGQSAASLRPRRGPALAWPGGADHAGVAVHSR